MDAVKTRRMTKEELNERIMQEFDIKEVALINFNIYYNPKYVEYYASFHGGKYSFCYKFLKQNRHLLTLAHTPKQWREQAKHTLSFFE